MAPNWRWVRAIGQWSPTLSEADCFAVVKALLGIELPEAGRYAMGMIFLADDAAAAERQIAILEATVREEGQRVLGWRPQVTFEQGVQTMLREIDQWGDAPVWTPQSIHEATRDWFQYLGRPATS